MLLMLLMSCERLERYQRHEYALFMRQPLDDLRQPLDDLRQPLDALKSQPSLDPVHHPTPIECAAGSGGKGAAGKARQDCPAPHAVPSRVHAPMEKERGLPGIVSFMQCPSFLY